MLVDDEIIIKGLKDSLITLAKHQLDKGTIPSNVKSKEQQHISYGSLVGRVDATSWFLVGAALYQLNYNDKDFWSLISPAVQKAEHILEAWEFNNKHLIYTPLSGNWADEYVMHGYLLYDNCLRLWGLRLIQQIKHSNLRENKIAAITELSLIHI